MNTQKLIDKFAVNIGLISNIFGKYADSIIYKTSKERAKQLLCELYGYKDIFDIFPPEVDEEKTMRVIKILNQFNENPLDIAEKNKK